MAASFSVDITRFVIKANVSTTAIIRRVAFDVFSRVIQKTPVKSGRAKGNWIPAINSIPGSSSDTTDPTGATTIAAMAVVTEQFKPGDIIYLANNLPYIAKLENGSSQQAPQGMVTLSLMEVKENLEAGR